MFYIIIIIIILVYAYNKINNNYWYNQPAFHIYNINYYFKENGTLITTDFIKKNKYCNLTNIKIYEINTINNNTLDIILDFIINNWTARKNYRLNKVTLLSYFKGHHNKCFLGAYYINNIIVATITNIPYNLYVNNKHYTSHYIDNLCVDINHRNKGIAAEMIETHCYVYEQNIKQLTLGFYERKYELGLINPSCIFDIYQCNVTSNVASNVTSNNKNNIIDIIECNSMNINEIYNIIKSKNKFDVLIIPDLENLLQLIQMRTYYVYFLKENNIIIAVYFFKRSCMYNNNNSEALYLIGSINISSNIDLFINGYMSAVTNICENNNFFILLIKNISDNNIIINKNMTKIITEAYYFKNIIIHNTEPRKFFCIN